MVRERTMGEISREMEAVRELLASPGWALLSARWREAEGEYDAFLHRERADDVVRMQTCQTTCKVLRDVLAAPERVLGELDLELRMVEG